MNRIITHTPNYIPLGQPPTSHTGYTHTNSAVAMSAMLSAADQGGNENDDGRPIDELIDEMIASEWNSGMTLQPNIRNDDNVEEEGQKNDYKEKKMRD